MTSDETTPRSGRLRRQAAAAAAVLLCLSFPAGAQEPRKPAPQTASAAPAQQPGMLDSMGRWFKDSYNWMSAGLGGARDRATGAAKEAADAAKDAADAAREAMTKFPNSKLIDGRQRCELASNGAPDCVKAAQAICKAKGFDSGSSLEIQSARKCSARVWISGQPAGPGDCELETFVTRAMCQ